VLIYLPVDPFLTASSGNGQFMSAALRNNDKCNDFEDDRESCLRVLTWTALCFTISGGSLSRFLRAFDEEYEGEDGVKGGDLK